MTEPVRTAALSAVIGLFLYTHASQHLTLPFLTTVIADRLGGSESSLPAPARGAPQHETHTGQNRTREIGIRHLFHDLNRPAAVAENLGRANCCHYEGSALGVKQFVSVFSSSSTRGVCGLRIGQRFAIGVCVGSSDFARFCSPLEPLAAIRGLTL